MATNLELALQAAEAGLSVYPMDKNGNPLVPIGEASMDEAQIRSWWSNGMSGSEVGVVAPASESIPIGESPVNSKLPSAQLGPPAAVKRKRRLGSLGDACHLLRGEKTGQILLPGLWPLKYDLMLDAMTGLGRRIDDVDIHATRERAENELRYRFSGNAMAEAMSVVAHENYVHGVRDHLATLPKWDGVERIKDVASKILGRPEDDLISAKFIRKFLISAVARATRPGCKCDSVLTLIGGEGVGKSTFLRELSDPWHVDTPIDVEKPVDAAKTMRRAWILEWAELQSALRARNRESVIGFISSATDVGREAYGRLHSEIPRTSVIAATTNKTDFLEHATNRRFWPIVVVGFTNPDKPDGPNRINRDLLRAWRDCLWAEALAALGGGEPWWLEAEEEIEALERRREHEAEDPWAEMICGWLETRSEPTTGECLSFVLPANTRVEKRDEQRMGGVLRSLGRDRSRKRDGKKLQWVWKNRPERAVR